MISKILLLNIFFSLSVFCAAQAYKTEPVSSEIHSIEVFANKDWNSYPVIKLNSSDYISLGFDKISENFNARLRYRVVCCNADWTKNEELSEVEYLDGFDDNLIEDYNNSINTTVGYTHYNLQIPNENVKLKLSGNYAIEVYDEDGDENEVLLTACFSILENAVNIVANVSTTTDIDANNEHHQLSFDLNYKMNLRDVKNDLKVFVRQNNRLDNERKNLKPNFVMPSKLRYTHNKDLIFEAGNEYHRFDMSSYRHNGKNIAHIEYDRPNYHMYLVPNRINEGGSYSYDQDQNGRVIYRNMDAGSVDIEGDYFFVHMTLHADKALPNDIYINGMFSYNNFSDIYKMIYNEENSEYYLTLFLKQGIYNYQYLTGKQGNLSPKEVEGSFYETEDEYSIYVYYRPDGKRHDELVGFTRISSREK